MKKISEAKLTIQKSKFTGYLFKINSKEEISEIVDLVSFENKKSRHICYAVIVNNEEISKNDSEVGSPGKVLLGILKDAKLTSHILIVSRIFGGIKLGVGGVSRAFREIARETLSSEGLDKL